MVDPSVIVVLGILVALGGVLATPVSQVIATMLRNRHDRDAAREDRRQRRLEATYAGTSEYLLRVRDMVQRTEPLMSMTGDPGPPEFPPDEELRRVEAEVVIHGSPAVLAELEALTRLVHVFRVDVMMLRSTRAAGGRALAQTEITTWQTVDADRAAVKAAVTSLLDRISRELREERPGR
jgi:hypothetical protein